MVKPEVSRQGDQRASCLARRRARRGDKQRSVAWPDSCSGRCSAVAGASVAAAGMTAMEVAIGAAVETSAGAATAGASPVSRVPS